MPYPHKGETEQEYISRFMASEEAQKSYPDQKQRAAVAYSMWKEHHSKHSIKEIDYKKMSYEELIKEHEKLVEVLKNDNSEEIASEYRDQKAELEKYLAEVKKFHSKEIIRYSLNGISIREEEGEFYSEGFIATTHVDRAREEDADYTALSKEALGQIVDYINSGVATIEGVGSTRTVSYRHDWVKKQDPTMPPAGMAVPPAELREMDNGHWGVWCKTHHNKNHPQFDKIKYDVQHGYLPGYSIEFKEGQTMMTRIANRTVKVIKSITNFVGYAFADARMIANPKALIESFGYREIIGDFMEENKAKELNTREVGIIDQSTWKPGMPTKGHLDASGELQEAKAGKAADEKDFSENVEDESEMEDAEDDESLEDYAKRIAEALAKGEEIPKRKGKEAVYTEKTKITTENKLKRGDKEKVEEKSESDSKKLYGAEESFETMKKKETDVDIKEIATKVKESKEFQDEVAKIKISTRVLNTAIGEEQMENIKIKEMKEALAKNDIETFKIQARELMDEEHLVEKALADPQNYTYRGMKSNLRTRCVGKGLKIVGDIQIRGTLDAATNPSTYTQSPVEFADLFMPGIIQTFNTQHNLFGFLKKVQHPGGVYFQWKMITNMDPLSNSTFVSRDDVSVLKNYANKLNYQTPLKIARRGVSVTDFIQRYSAQSLGDLFQAEVQIQMDQMMIDVEAGLFAEMADGTGLNPLGLEAVADSAGNTTLYGYTRSTANRLSPAAAGDTYVELATAITEAAIRNGIQKLATAGVHPSNMAIVTSPKGKSFMFNLLDTNRRFNTTLAEFGFDQKTVASYDGIPIIESWKCDSTIATATSTSACAYIIDTENDVIVMAMEPKLVGLAKVGPATEAYLEMDFAHVYMQPRKIHMINNFSTG